MVALFRGANSYRGIEVILRHSPAQTGLKYWTFSGYAHFRSMPKLKVGEHVRMGQVLGPIGNSGRGREPGVQSRKRRPAIHFYVIYGKSPEFFISRNKVVVPKGGWWTDPNAFLAGMKVLDTRKLRALPKGRKSVRVGAMSEGGKVLPKGAKTVWPFLCKG